MRGLVTGASFSLRKLLTQHTFPAQMSTQERKGPMTTILFVHGTGGRAADHERAFTLIARKLAQYSARADLHLAPCLWREQFGAQLHHLGATIPLYDSTRSLDEMMSGELPDADAERMLWGLLYQDPLYELRLLALREGGTTDPVSPIPINFNSISPGEMLDEVVQSFTFSAELKDKNEIVVYDVDQWLITGHIPHDLEDFCIQIGKSLVEALLVAIQATDSTAA